MSATVSPRVALGLAIALLGEPMPAAARRSTGSKPLEELSERPVTVGATRIVELLQSRATLSASAYGTIPLRDQAFPHMTEAIESLVEGAQRGGPE